MAVTKHDRASVLAPRLHAYLQQFVDEGYLYPGQCREIEEKVTTILAEACEGNVALTGEARPLGDLLTEDEVLAHSAKILAALDLGLQAWRTTNSRDRFVEATASLGVLRAALTRLVGCVAEAREDHALTIVHLQDAEARVAEAERRGQEVERLRRLESEAYLRVVAERDGLRAALADAGDALAQIAVSPIATDKANVLAREVLGRLDQESGGVADSASRKSAEPE